MDLLIAANTVIQAQADTAPASGTPGWATDGNPATGLLATDAPAWHYNMMMAELIAIIKAAGFTPSNADWSQVLKAMQTIFAPAQYGVAPFSASLAQLIGGYPLGAIAFDAAGNYWQSTKANNLTVPGADGATWVNFFAGVMTQQQADLRYLLLTGGNVKGAMDWGDKTAAGTTTHRFWSAGAPAEGDATPDATLTISGGTPGTANQGSVALSTKELDLSGTGQVLVPDVEDFATKQALSAQIAEERYPASVPTTGQARITSLVQDANGRTLSNGAVLANLADLPIAPTDKIQRFTVTGAVYEQTIPYPEAFSSEDVTLIMTVQAVDDSPKGLVLANYRSGTKTPTGFGIRLIYLNGYGNQALPSSDPANVDIIAIGPG
ncbi:hypothetical protein [Acetobacter lambici]|uniref:Uncharacterized protein n=1 Tax=Acetobacter lambici TaxID=1332824 RepID=A0ABT1F1J6_9PROT|nr:hypothetical protein [Acetobacter lambici]MCP1242917.1 hypothetical protein [Acetobacter lambici]MCP1259087.1 hypothetical protein [Acetobacter lambici]